MALLDQKDRRAYRLGLKIAGDFGATIAIPVVSFVLIGRYLDSRYGGGAWYTIIAFVLAALISGTSIYRKAKAYGKEYQEEILAKDKQADVRSDCPDHTSGQNRQL